MQLRGADGETYEPSGKALKLGCLLPNHCVQINWYRVPHFQFDWYHASLNLKAVNLAWKGPINLSVASGHTMRNERNARTSPLIGSFIDIMSQCENTHMR